MNKNKITYSEKNKYGAWVIHFIVKNTEKPHLLNQEIKRQFMGYTKKEALKLAKNELVTTIY